MFIISNKMYISEIAETFAEFTQSTYTCSVVILMILDLKILTVQQKEALNIINVNDIESIASQISLK